MGPIGRGLTGKAGRLLPVPLRPTVSGGQSENILRPVRRVRRIRADRSRTRDGFNDCSEVQQMDVALILQHPFEQFSFQLQRFGQAQVQENVSRQRQLLRCSLGDCEQSPLVL
eukprot:s1533_g15.t1